MTTNKPTKVLIEITAEGWSECVYADDQLIAEKRHIMISSGGSKEDGERGERGDWYDILPDEPQLAESLDDLSFGPFGAAGALYEIDEEWS